jgi:hypothetical protein
MKLRKNFLTVLFVLNIFLGLAWVADAQNTAPAPTTLTKEERKALVAYLKETRDKLLADLKGLSEAQMNFKSGPTRWSVRETTQHIILAESFLLNTVTTQLVKTPATPEKRASVAGVEDKIKQVVPDRSRKFQAPEPLVPSEERVPGDVVAEFKKRRAATIKYVEETNDDLRDHFMDNPLTGASDGMQWIYFLAAHSARHTKQVEEVKADPNFPKK